MAFSKTHLTQIRRDSLLPSPVKFLLPNTPQLTSLHIPRLVRWYLDMCDDLYTDDIFLKGHHIIFPLAVWDSHLADVQEGQHGTSKCHQSARDTTYWPIINAIMESYIKGTSTVSRPKSLCPPNQCWSLWSLKDMVKSQNRCLRMEQQTLALGQYLFQ